MATCLVAALQAKALDPSIHVNDFDVREWRIEDGLPANHATGIIQTRDGYIWVGTQRGLARYDGHRFTVYDHITNPELVNRYITAVSTDAAGDLLVSSHSNGVFRLVGNRFVPVLTAAQVDRGEVFDIRATRDGSLLVSARSGLFRRTPAGAVQRFTAENGLPCSAVLQAFEAADGVIWASTCKGTARIAGRRVDATPLAPELEGTSIAQVRQLPNGTIYVLSYRKGLFAFDGRTVRRIATSPEGAGSLAMTMVSDREGNIWVGGTAGLQRILAGAASGDSLSTLKPMRVHELREAADGSIWAATQNGVQQIRKTVFTAYGSRNGLADDNVISVNTDRSGALFFGTQQGGVYTMRGRSIETLIPPAVKNAPGVWALIAAADGAMWAGMDDDQLHVIRGGKGRAVTQWPSVETVARPDGSMWRVRRGAIHEYDAAQRFVREIKPAGLTGRQYFITHPARDGGIYLGTLDAGTFHIDATGQHARLITADACLYVAHEDERALWIGTLGGGLLRIADGRTTRFRQSDGLPDDDVLALVDDGHGYLWMGTTVGIARVSRAELEAFAEGRLRRLSPKVFGLADGLPTLECNGGHPGAVRTSDGWLWFATARGLVKVNPDPRQLRLNDPLADTIIESAVGPRTPNGRFRAGRRPLTFSFTVPSFHDTAAVRFRYKLEGFDDDWTDAGLNRTATYTNVPYGRFRFVVQARTGEGPWASWSRGATYALQKERAWYETHWFRISVLVLVVALAAFVYSWRVRALHKRQVALEGIVAERTALLAKANASLEKMSLADPLTGIANRRSMDDHLEREWRRAQKASTTVAFLFIDVDFFKKYNDAYGHQAGDHCLVAVATAIASAVKRPTDLAARYGGEEFAVVLPGTDIAGALRVAEDIRAAVAALALPHGASAVAPVVTLSIGAAAMVPGNAQLSRALVETADHGVYKAKEAGRNQIAAADLSQLEAVVAA